MFRQNILFWFVLIASGPVSGHHSEEPSSIILAPFLQVFIHIDKILLRLLQAEQSQFSQPSLRRDATVPQ